MIFDLETFTAIHTAISFVALAAGGLAIAGLLTVRIPSWVTSLFLVTAVATSATGFGFPFNGVLPSHVIGLVALVVLAAVIMARFLYGLQGAWAKVYACGMVASLYFIVFVAIVQAFMKVPALKSIAPTGAELPFVVTQFIVLLIFVALGIAAARVSRYPGPLRVA